MYFKIFLAPRSSSQLRPVKAPRSRSAVPQQMKEKTANHSLEMLEQLSLTREEWIDYFRTKKLPPLAEIELEKLQQKRVPDHYNRNIIFPNNPAVPFVTKL